MLWINRLLLITIALLGILGVGTFYAYSQIDTETLKVEAAKWVAKNYQRQLLLNGAVKPTFFPLGVEVNDVRLSEKLDNIEDAKQSAKIDDSFVSIGSIRLAINTWALLDKTVIIKTIQISNSRANIIRKTDGNFNFMDLLGETPPKPTKTNKQTDTTAAPKNQTQPAKEGSAKSQTHWRIANINIQDLTINYRDLASKDNFRLSKVTFALENLAPEKLAHFSFSANLSAQSEALPQLDTQINTSGDIRLQLPEVEGERAQPLSILIQNLKMKIAADADIRDAGNGRLQDFLLSGQIAHHDGQTTATLDNVSLKAIFTPITEAKKNIPITIDVQNQTPIKTIIGENSQTVQETAIGFSVAGGFAQEGLELSQTRVNGTIGATLIDGVLKAQIGKLFAKTQLSADAIKGDADINVETIILSLPIKNPKALIAQWQALDAKANLRGDFGTASANLAHQNLKTDLTKGKITSAPLLLEVDFLGDSAQSKVKINAPINGVLDKNLQLQSLALTPISIAGSANAPALPQPIPINLEGQISLQKLKTLALKLKGDLAKSQLGFEANVPDLQTPAVGTKFSLTINHFDLDTWLPPAQMGSKDSKATPKTPSDNNFDANNHIDNQNIDDAPTDIAIDLSALKGLSGNARVEVGELKARGVVMRQLNMNASADGTTINLNPLSMNIADGTFNGKAVLTPKSQNVALFADLKKVDFGSLLNDLKITDVVHGKATINFDLTTEGKSLNAFKKTLNGNITLLANDGGIKGFNIAQSIRKIKAKFDSKSDSSIKAENADERYTDFAELSAKFKATNGVLATQDLKMLSPYFRLLGEGSVDLAKEQLDFRTRVITTSSNIGQGTDSNTIKGKGIPIKIKGSLTDPKIAIDSAALKDFYLKAETEKIKTKLKVEKAEAEKKLKAKTDAEKKKVQEKLKARTKDALEDKIKDLFK